MATDLHFTETVLQTQEEHPENKVYTGVGSRETPATILAFITKLAEQLAKQSWILRSGGATGADSAFETGSDEAGGRKEIYLPWKGFNGNSSSRFLNLPQSGTTMHIQDPSAKRAVELAVQFHPLKNQLLAPTHKMRTILKLMARNSQQVLGETVSEENKSAFVICWTPKGELKGGTRQAILLAQHFHIPVFNLGNPQILEQVQAALQQD